MASLEIREDLFYEYVVIWGRGGETLLSSSGSDLLPPDPPPLPGQ